MANYFTAREFANGQFAANIHATVNVRRIRFTASNQKFLSFEFLVLSFAFANQTVFP